MFHWNHNFPSRYDKYKGFWRKHFCYNFDWMKGKKYFRCKHDFFSYKVISENNDDFFAFKKIKERKLRKRIYIELMQCRNCYFFKKNIMKTEAQK